MVVIWASLKSCGNFSVSQICEKRERSLSKSTGSATLTTSGVCPPVLELGFVWCIALLISSLLGWLSIPWTIVAWCKSSMVPGLTAEGRLSKASKCSLHRLRIACSSFIRCEPSPVFGGDTMHIFGQRLPSERRGCSGCRVCRCIVADRPPSSFSSLLDSPQVCLSCFAKVSKMLPLVVWLGD